MKTDDLVRMKPERLDYLTVTTRKQIEGRVGRVQRVFVRFGAKKETASVYWRYKNGKERKYSDFWPVEFLELVP